MEFPKEHCTDIETPSGQFDCVLGIRPEQLIISESEGHIPGTIYASQAAGSETLVYVTVQNERLLVKMIGLKSFKRNQNVWLEIKPELMTVYDAKSELLLKRSVDNSK